MLRWLVEYIDNNKIEWEKNRKEQIKERKERERHGKGCHKKRR